MHIGAMMRKRMLEQKQHIVDSAISYGAGGGLFVFASLADIATVAQQLGIILGCLVVAVRLVSDVRKLFSEMKKK
jgi:hypothetical protein